MVVPNKLTHSLHECPFDTAFAVRIWHMTPSETVSSSQCVDHTPMTFLNGRRRRADANPEGGCTLDLPANRPAHPTPSKIKLAEKHGSVALPVAVELQHIVSLVYEASCLKTRLSQCMLAC